MGLSGLYRKFICLYAAIAQPLTNMLRRDSFHWDSTALAAFEKLKQAMVSASVLSLPNFAEQFTVQTDASRVAMGAVLLQNEHPIAYFSQAFCPRMSKASAYLRELQAITSAVKGWRQYLLGTFFIIQTDHKSLKELLTQVIQTPEQQHYLAKLLGFSYEIRYKPGSSNIVADALSRSLEPNSAEIHSLSVPQPIFLTELKSELAGDPFFISLRAKLEAKPHEYPDLSLRDGLILKKGRIWLSPSSKFRNILIREYHESLMGGHAGMAKTLQRLSAKKNMGQYEDRSAGVHSAVLCLSENKILYLETWRSSATVTNSFECLGGCFDGLHYRAATITWLHSHSCSCGSFLQRYSLMGFTHWLYGLQGC